MEECKYEIKKIKIDNLIYDELEPSSPDDEVKNDSYSETEFDNDE